MELKMQTWHLFILVQLNFKRIKKSLYKSKVHYWQLVVYFATSLSNCDKETVSRMFLLAFLSVIAVSPGIRDAYPYK